MYICVYVYTHIIECIYRRLRSSGGWRSFMLSSRCVCVCVCVCVFIYIYISMHMHGYI